MFAVPFVLAAFINPAIFYGGAAAMSVPILIHLLNKRRFRVIVWAAMDFLLAAQRRNARKLKFQRWLLLILRCLALLLLGMAIGQFFINDNLLASVFGSGERAVVVIWDDSYSMGYRAPPKPSHFDASKKLLTEWLAGVSTNDKVAVVRGSSGGQKLVDKPTLDHRAAAQAVAAQNVSDGATDLATGVDNALKSLEEVEHTAQTKSVVLITDLSRSSLLAGNTSDDKAGGEGTDTARDHLRKKIAALREKASFRVVDMGEAEQNNRAITGLETAKPIVVAGVPADLKVTVRNATDTPLIEHPLAISVDGVLQDTVKLGRIAPGETLTTTVSVKIDIPGRHMIEASIPGDLLPVDDVRRLALNVSRELPVLLVEGDPGDNRRTMGSTTYLQVALASASAPTTGGGTGGGTGPGATSPSLFAPRVISELELPRTPLGSSGDHRAYMAVALSDIGRLEAPVLAALKQYVTDGGLLIVLPGARTNANEINMTLGDGGVKLLAASYGQLVRLEPGQAGEGMHFAPGNYAHPWLAAFATAARSGKDPGLDSVQVDRYLRMAVPTDGTVETVLSLSDGNAEIITKQVGKGRVVQFATPADNSWTSIAAKPVCLELMCELLFNAMTSDSNNLTVELGGSIHLPVDMAAAGLWNGPRGSKISVVTDVDKDKRAWLTGGPLLLAGMYGPGGAAPVVAVNPDGREADIRHIKTAEFAAELGIEPSAIVNQPKALETPQASGERTKNAGGDLGLKLLLVVLGVLALEAFLARAFSMYR